MSTEQSIPKKVLDTPSLGAEYFFDEALQALYDAKYKIPIGGLAFICPIHPTPQTNSSGGIWCEKIIHGAYWCIRTMFLLKMSIGKGG